jgi:thiol-disulfide isomerase/thioredoxin
MIKPVIIAVIAVSSLQLLAYCSLSKKKAEIPSFNLLLIDSSTLFNTRQIPDGRPIALVFFSPDCEHCQKETSSLLTKMDSLKNVRFYFVAIDPLERLKVFNTYYQIYRYPNITLGRDYTVFFPGFFKGATPPYLVLYDGYKKTQAVFDGEADISRLIGMVNKMTN